MSRSLNKIMIIGNVGSDPDVRATSTGNRVAKFSVATNDGWGEREEVNFHRCTVFGKLVDVVENYVRKGQKIYLEGRVSYSTTEDASGNKRYWTDVVVNELIMLGGGVFAPEDRPQPQPAGSITDPEDDLPFAPMRLTHPMV